MNSHPKPTNAPEPNNTEIRSYSDAPGYTLYLDALELHNAAFKTVEVKRVEYDYEGLVGMFKKWRDKSYYDTYTAPGFEYAHERWADECDKALGLRGSASKNPEYAEILLLAIDKDERKSVALNMEVLRKLLPSIEGRNVILQALLDLDTLQERLVVKAQLDAIYKYVDERNQSEDDIAEAQTDLATKLQTAMTALPHFTSTPEEVSPAASEEATNEADFENTVEDTTDMTAFDYAETLMEAVYSEDYLWNCSADEFTALQKIVDDLQTCLPEENRRNVYGKATVQNCLKVATKLRPFNNTGSKFLSRLQQKINLLQTLQAMTENTTIILHENSNTTEHVNMVEVLQRAVFVNAESKNLPTYKDATKHTRTRKRIATDAGIVATAVAGVLAIGVAAKEYVTPTYNEVAKLLSTTDDDATSAITTPEVQVDKATEPETVPIEEDDVDRLFALPDWAETPTEKVHTDPTEYVPLPPAEVEPNTPEDTPVEENTSNTDNAFQDILDNLGLEEPAKANDDDTAPLLDLLEATEPRVEENKKLPVPEKESKAPSAIPTEELQTPKEAPNANGANKIGSPTVPARPAPIEAMDDVFSLPDFSETLPEPKAPNVATDTPAKDIPAPKTAKAVPTREPNPFSQRDTLVEPKITKEPSNPTPVTPEKVAPQTLTPSAPADSKKSAPSVVAPAVPVAPEKVAPPVVAPTDSSKILQTPNATYRRKAVQQTPSEMSAKKPTWQAIEPIGEITFEEDSGISDKNLTILRDVFNDLEQLRKNQEVIYEHQIQFEARLNSLQETQEDQGGRLQAVEEQIKTLRKEIAAMHSTPSKPASKPKTPVAPQPTRSSPLTSTKEISCEPFTGTLTQPTLNINGQTWIVGKIMQEQNGKGCLLLRSDGCAVYWEQGNPNEFTNKIWKLNTTLNGWIPVNR